MSAAATILSAILLIASASPDEVKMKDGKEYKNLTLVKETPTHYTFADLDDKKITIAKDQVEKYEKKPTVRDELRERIKKAKPDDAKQLMDIAMWAKAQGMPKDSREVLELVIKADPENADARAALDYVKFEGAWVPKKDLEGKFEGARSDQLKALGFKSEGGKLVSPGESARSKLKLVQVGKHWVTPEQKKSIEAKELEFREGDWLTKDEVAKFKAGERKVNGAWKPILDADEAHREPKNPWVLKGVYVEVRSILRHSKIAPAYKAADDAVNAAVELSGIEPDIWSKGPPLVVVIEKDIESWKARAKGRGVGSDWAAMRSDDGVFYADALAKGAGESITYFHDENHMRWWAGRGAFEAWVGRLTDITRLDPVLLDAFAGYFGAFDGEKYSPSAPQNYLFDRNKPMRPATKMFQGFSRKDSYHIPQAGFLIHFLVKKNKEGTTRALHRFLAGNLKADGLIQEVLGKVDPAELDKEYEEVWTKFRDNFRP